MFCPEGMAHFLLSGLFLTIFDQSEVRASPFPGGLFWFFIDAGEGVGLAGLKFLGAVGINLDDHVAVHVPFPFGQVDEAGPVGQRVGDVEVPEDLKTDPPGDAASFFAWAQAVFTLLIGLPSKWQA